MKTPTTMKKLSTAIALAAISASTVAVSKAEAAIIQVNPNTLTGVGLITFDEVVLTQVIPGGSGEPDVPAENYNSIFFAQDYTDTSVGVNFAERFVGQTLSYLPPIPPGTGQFDDLSGTPSSLLSLQVGSLDQNVAVWSDGKILSGVGPLAFPNADAVGEGAIAILFPRAQKEFGFDLSQADPDGSVTLNFFNRNGGTPIGTIKLDNANYGNGFYGFKATLGDEIWGVSITNYDPLGIAIDTIIYDNPGAPEPPPQNVPEPASVLGLLGLGVLGGGLKLKSKFKS